MDLGYYVEDAKDAEANKKALFPPKQGENKNKKYTELLKTANVKGRFSSFSKKWVAKYCPQKAES